MNMNKVLLLLVIVMFLGAGTLLFSIVGGPLRLWRAVQQRIRWIQGQRQAQRERVRNASTLCVADLLDRYGATLSLPLEPPRAPLFGRGQCDHEVDVVARFGHTRERRTIPEARQKLGRVRTPLGAPIPDHGLSRLGVTRNSEKQGQQRCRRGRR